MRIYTIALKKFLTSLMILGCAALAVSVSACGCQNDAQDTSKSDISATTREEKSIVDDTVSADLEKDKSENGGEASAYSSDKSSSDVSGVYGSSDSEDDSSSSIGSSGNSSSNSSGKPAESSASDKKPSSSSASSNGSNEDSLERDNAVIDFEDLFGSDK